MDYQDFELLTTGVHVVKEGGQKRITFKVQVPHTPVGETAQVRKGVPSEYDVREMRKHLNDWENRELAWPDVIEMGNWLAMTLFPEPVRNLLERSLDHVQAQGEGLRIRLLLGGPPQNFPWEYVLFNRGGGEAASTDFLGLNRNVSIVRDQAVALPRWDVKADLPARIHVALANPTDGYDPLDLDEERRYIEQTLKGDPHIQPTFAADATPESMLLGVERTHLFHFAGHGDFEGRMGRQPGAVEGKGLIVLDDGQGKPRKLSASTLALRLRQAGVRVAVLGACRSGRRGDVNTWSSVATALLKGGLGAVVAMQYKIRNKSAIAFAGAFYKALVSGLPIDEAVTAGRLAIAITEDVRGWGVPVLYLRAPDGIIFPEYTADPTLKNVRNQLRATARQTIDVLRGKASVFDIGTITDGHIEAEQRIGTIAERGEAIGIRIEHMGSAPRARAAREESGAASLTCPRCHARVEAAWKFCPNCRADLSAGPDHCTQCGVKLTSSAKFCPQCGTKVE